MFQVFRGARVLVYASGCVESCEEDGRNVAGVEEGGEAEAESSKDSLRLRPMFIL